MISRKVTIKNPTGFHLRPAGRLCEAALHYKSSIHFKRGSTDADVKSLLSVLGACVKCGDELVLSCDGEDEREAMEALTGLIESGLGE